MSALQGREDAKKNFYNPPSINGSQARNQYDSAYQSGREQARNDKFVADEKKRWEEIGASVGSSQPSQQEGYPSNGKLRSPFDLSFWVWNTIRLIVIIGMCNLIAGLTSQAFSYKVFLVIAVVFCYQQYIKYKDYKKYRAKRK